jgi:hypothetical protein
MHRALLGLAAIIAAALPTTAGQAQAFSGSSSVRSGEFRGSPPFRGDFRDLCRGFRRDRDGDRRRFDRCRTDVVMDWYGGEWALYNNRSWAPDSYNDWWNDRPDRAYPAWMRRNEDCQRQWFSGDVLRC